MRPKGARPQPWIPGLGSKLESCFNPNLSTNYLTFRKIPGFGSRLESCFNPNPNYLTFRKLDCSGLADFPKRGLEFFYGEVDVAVLVSARQDERHGT